MLSLIRNNKTRKNNMKLYRIIIFENENVNININKNKKKRTELTFNNFKIFLYFIFIYHQKHFILHQS